LLPREEIHDQGSKLIWTEIQPPENQRLYKGDDIFFMALKIKIIKILNQDS
jgi:hypothetical protein